MKLPYVIDNQSHKLADVLNQVMQGHPGMSLDISTAYFSVSGYHALREQMNHLRSFRLLLGFQPTETTDLGLRPTASALKWTNDLIDQVVYRLYGLTEEEFAIMDGRGRKLKLRITQIGFTQPPSPYKRKRMKITGALNA